MVEAGSSRDVLERTAIMAVIDAVARDHALHEQYVLKGGLALQLAFGSPRRSDDLDFNAVHPSANEITDATKRELLSFADRLDEALRSTAPEYGFDRIAVDAKRPSEEIPALLADVAFAMGKVHDGRVKLQLTLSEVICASEIRRVHGLPLHTASLEDILSEKLKALLQQITRETVRSTDVFDLWYFTSQSDASVNPERVTRFLLKKCEQWVDLPPLEKSQFKRKSVVRHSAQEYENLKTLLPAEYPLASFREAYECVIRFVNLLDLPG